MTTDDHDRALEALRLAADDRPHSGADLALALRLLKDRTRPPVPVSLEALTPAEADVVRMIATEGLMTKVIAGRMGLAEKTVKNHLYASMKKFGVHSRSGLVAAFWGTR